MAWFRVQLTEEEQRVVNEERRSHPNLRIREKMLVLWLLHNGLTRQKAAEVVGVGRATVQRYVAAFRAGGLGRPAAVERQSPGQRDGRLSRLDPRVLRRSNRPDRGRGVRTHLSIDRTAPRSQPGAQVSQGSGPEVSAGPHDPGAAQKNLAEHVANPSRISRHQTEAAPGRRPSGTKVTCSSSTRPISCSGRSCVACGRSRGSSSARLRVVSGSTCWGRGMR